jgi:hypothetical protein
VEHEAELVSELREDETQRRRVRTARDSEHEGTWP